MAYFHQKYAANKINGKWGNECFFPHKRQIKRPNKPGLFFEEQKTPFEPDFLTKGGLQPDPSGRNFFFLSQ